MRANSESSAQTTRTRRVSEAFLLATVQTTFYRCRSWKNFNIPKTDECQNPQNKEITKPSRNLNVLNSLVSNQPHVHMVKSIMIYHVRFANYWIHNGVQDHRFLIISLNEFCSHKILCRPYKLVAFGFWTKNNVSNVRVLMRDWSSNNHDGKRTVDNTKRR